MDTSVLPRFREVLAGIALYRPSAAPAGPDGRTHLLATNESPHGPLPSVVDALVRAAGQLNRYPDHGSAELARAIARRTGVEAEQVVAGCGSTGVLQTLLCAVAEPGAEVVFPWPSFEAYPRMAALAGLVPVAVPLRDHAHDLDTMAAAVTEATRMVVVCNPNSPTGTGIHRTDLERFLDRVPATCLVVLDEAYREYVRDDAVPDGLTLRPRRNVAVVRTFSKAYGLAGLRVGYCIADPEVAALLRRCGLAFGVNRLAQHAAVASLGADAELRRRVDDDVAERDRVAAALRGLGIAVPRSHGNFLWLPLGGETERYAAACAARGVVARSVAGHGLRVTVGLPESNDAFVAAVRTVVADTTPVGRAA